MKVYHLQNYINNRTASIHKEEEGYSVMFFIKEKTDWLPRGVGVIYKTEKEAIDVAIIYISKEINK